MDLRVCVLHMYTHTHKYVYMYITFSSALRPIRPPTAPAETKREQLPAVFTTVRYRHRPSKGHRNPRLSGSFLVFPV